MLAQLLHGSLLIFVTVAIHAFTLSWCLQHLIPQTAPDARSFLQTTLLIARIALLVILAHLAGILVWSLYYLFNGIVPHMEEAFYFSAVTYATIGYGDIVPPPDWRLLASMEGLTGILMCSWSGGFFFAVASRISDTAPRPGVRP